MTACPATVTVVERALPSFTATAMVTLPERLPLGFAVTTAQFTGLDADHAQPLGVSTVSVRVAPAAGTVALAGVTAKRHGAAC